MAASVCLLGVAATGATAIRAVIFAHACKLGFEGIVSKHRTRPYRSGRSKTWLKIKNPKAPGVLRFEDRDELA
jgi:ATP-dependent DNA ligase